MTIIIIANAQLSINARLMQFASSRQVKSLHLYLQNKKIIMQAEVIILYGLLIWTRKTQRKKALMKFDIRPPLGFQQWKMILSISNPSTTTSIFNKTKIKMYKQIKCVGIMHQSR